MPAGPNYLFSTAVLSVGSKQGKYVPQCIKLGKKQRNCSQNEHEIIHLAGKFPCCYLVSAKNILVRFVCNQFVLH